MSDTPTPLSSVSGTVTNTACSFTHPGFSTPGTYTITIVDQNNVSTTSNPFVVDYAVATAATLANVPWAGVVGSPITGITCALTPSYAQGFVCLSTGGADVGTRQAFTGATPPVLTATAAGIYDVVLYAALTGGTALATSSAITVSATMATAATISGAPATALGGVAITGITCTLTPANAAAYAVLNNGTADVGSRVVFVGAANLSVTPPAGAVGTYTAKIYSAATGGTLLATSSAITVTDIATAATITGAPASGYAGVAITGLTTTLTPTDATAYAALWVDGAQEGTRYPFTGTTPPALTPAGAGSYTVEEFAALTGGTALATSAPIPVTIVATAATVTAPATATTGMPITTATATLTPAGATGYACLNNGADIGTRIAFTGTVPPQFTATATGTDTIKIYAALTGGSALATSGNITVSAPANATPTINGGVVASMVLDASVASHVTSDTGFTTPQTTNGGAVNGWKDASGNGFNFSNTGSGAILVTNSQNGLNGITFPMGGSPVTLNLTGSQATALGALFASATTGVTVAMVCEYTTTAPSGAAELFHITTSSGPGVVVGPIFSQFSGVGNFGAGEPLGAAVANTLNMVVMTFNPVTFVGNIWINGVAVASNTSTTNFTTSVFTGVQVGNGSGGSTDATNTIYEIDIWPTIAGGTGGATPTGDIATIFNYLNAKWV